MECILDVLGGDRRSGSIQLISQPIFYEEALLVRACETAGGVAGLQASNAVGRGQGRASGLLARNKRFNALSHNFEDTEGSSGQSFKRSTASLRYCEDVVHSSALLGQELSPLSIQVLDDSWAIGCRAEAELSASHIK